MLRVRIMVFITTFNKIFSYIVVVSFISGGNWSTRRKPPTCRKSLYHIMLYRLHLAISGIPVLSYNILFVYINCEHVVKLYRMMHFYLTWAKKKLHKVQIFCGKKTCDPSQSAVHYTVIIIPCSYYCR